MINTKKIIAIAISAALIASVFTGCGSSAKSISKTNTTKSKVTLVFGTNRTDVADSTIKALGTLYTKENPNITISIESYKDPDTVLKTRQAAGELPDLAIVPDNEIQSDLPLYYVPLDDLGFNDSNMYNYNLGVGTDGKEYKLNSSVGYQGIIYNKKAFQSAGIVNPPQTMVDFYADCAKLLAKGIIPLASNYKDEWPLGVYSDFTLAESQLGNANYKNTLGDKNLFGDKDGLLYGFDFLRTMYQRGYLEKDLMSTNWDQMKKDQASGKIAMAYLGTWYPPQVIQDGANQADIGMFPFPGVKKLLIGGDWSFGIPKTSKHITEAKAFLKWLWTDGRYATAVSIPSPIKGSKITDPAIKQLLSYNLPTMASVNDSTKIAEMVKQSQIDLNQAIQQYVITKDTSSVIKKYNDMWNAVK